MPKYFNKILKYFQSAQNIQKFIFGICFYIIICISIFVTIETSACANDNSIILKGCILAIPFVVVITKFAFKYSKKLTIKSHKEKTTANKLKFFFIVFLINLLLFLALYFVFYPGFYSFDSNYQLDLVQNHLYNDWHPYIQTLLAFEIPLSITGNIGSLALIQLFFFAATIAFMIETIYEITNSKIAIISYLFIIINPNTSLLSISMIKDSSLCIVYAISLTSIARLWLCKDVNLMNILLSILLAVCIALSTCFRHGFLIVTVCLLVFCFFNLNKKYKAIIITLSVTLVLIIQFPLSSILNVQKIPLYRRHELVLLPQNTFFNVYKNHADDIDESIKNDFFDLDPKESYDNIFLHDYNHEPTYYLRRNMKSYEQILQLWLDTFKLIAAYPKSSLEAICQLNLFELTFADLSYAPQLFWLFNSTDSNPAIDPQLVSLFWKAQEILGMPFAYLGLYFLFTTYLVLSKCDFRKKDDRIKALLGISIIVYAFLSGLGIYTKEFRYFVSIELVLPILTVMMCYKKPSFTKIKRQHH